jgi:hypothetical protein
MITCNRTIGTVTNSMLVLQARKACKKRWFDSSFWSTVTEEMPFNRVNLPGSSYQLPSVALKLHQTYSTRALRDKPDMHYISV